MLVMAQNKKAMFDTAHARLFVQQSVNNEDNTCKPWVVVSFSEGRVKDPHPIIVSSHDTEEEAVLALTYIYTMAVARHPAISMANPLAETCF